MKDRSGIVLKPGDKFVYQIDGPHECTGEIFDCGGIEVIKWDDDCIISVEDFYYAPIDSEIMEKI